MHNADKVHMGRVRNYTEGANLRNQVAAEPNTNYFVSVGNYEQRTSGDYTLTVKMQ